VRDDYVRPSLSVNPSVAISFDGAANDGRLGENDTLLGVEKLDSTVNGTFTGGPGADDFFVRGAGRRFDDQRRRRQRQARRARPRRDDRRRRRRRPHRGRPRQRHADRRLGTRHDLRRLDGGDVQLPLLPDSRTATT
jgi:hypothetical protein